MVGPPPALVRQDTFHDQGFKQSLPPSIPDPQPGTSIEWLRPAEIDPTACLAAKQRLEQGGCLVLEQGGPAMPACESADESAQGGSEAASCALALPMCAGKRVAFERPEHAERATVERMQACGAAVRVPPPAGASATGPVMRRRAAATGDPRGN